MGETNLDQLALKAIQDYAAFSVRLESFEKALLAITKRNEELIDKFAIACERLSRFEERLITLASDRETISTRIGVLENIHREHTEDHCNDCALNLGCDTKHEDIDEFMEKMQSLVPVAKAVSVVRDQALVWLLVILLIFAAWVAVTALSAKAGIQPPSIHIEKRG